MADYMGTPTTDIRLGPSVLITRIMLATGRSRPDVVLAMDNPQPVQTFGQPRGVYVPLDVE